MLRCVAVSTDERTKAHMELSGVRQTCRVWHPRYRWVGIFCCCYSQFIRPIAMPEISYPMSLSLYLQILRRSAIIVSFTIGHQWDSIAQRRFVEYTRTTIRITKPRYTNEGGTQSWSHIRRCWWVSTVDTFVPHTISMSMTIPNHTPVSFRLSVIISDDSPNNSIRNPLELNNGDGNSAKNEPTSTTMGESVSVCSIIWNHFPAKQC